MDLHDKAVTVVGLGRSALAAARLLRRLGARPFVTDSGPGAPAIREALRDLGIPFEVDGHSPAAFAEADLLVMSPGVPAAIAPVAAARAAGTPVWAELELAARHCPAPVLAVTGTNGKTTTTELLRAMLAACGHEVALAGNNATAFSEVALRPAPPDYVVLEVSSYQLETTDTFHPWIAAVLNLSPDHLARHGDMAGYAAAKARIFARQGAGDAAVINLDDPAVAAMPTPEGTARVGFSQARRVEGGLWLDGAVLRWDDTPLMTLADFPLPGRHNRENLLAALAMARAGGFAPDAVVAGARAFRGVEHRIEAVLAFDGITVYNDSKSTNLDSLRVALESFDGPIVLIAGGVGKGADYAPLRDLVAARVRRLVTVGEDAPKLEAAFGGLVACGRADSMRDAVAQAYAAARPGDVVLLSPGCASFDWYGNFEERGADFKHWARALAPAALEVER
jgi:UDP-N-acetylmuramoylalanine--D-glutamate ligase